MTLSGLNYFGFVLSIAIFAFGVAVALITLGQNRRARPNQYFALTTLGLGIWGIPNGLHYAAYYMELDPNMLARVGSYIYTCAVLMFLFFITEIDTTSPRHLVRRWRLAGVVWSVIALAMIARGYLWTEATLRNQDTYTFTAGMGGIIIFAGAGAILAGAAFHLQTAIFNKYRNVIYAEIPIFVGVGFLGLFGAPLGHFINGLCVLISILLAARIVLRNQLFNPLVELYHELTLKNTQLEEASKRKSEFLANMSHELRTPLNSIIGYTELILNGIYGELDERMNDRLSKVRRNGKDLLTLINDVLDLSKIDAGRLDLTPIHLAPTPLIDEVIVTLESLANEKKQTLLKQYHDLPMLYVDEIRARQAILNILANMIKFTGENHSVQIGGYFDAMRNQVIITMRANSGGMNNADAFKVRQAIQSNEELPSEQFADFGLGLAVSKRLVELHGGRVWFDSMSTTMHISFPAAAELKRPTIKTDLTTDETDSRPLILVIDDDVEAIEVMQGYMEASGYRIFGALSGHEGLLRARELSPALITLDSRMPGLDGWGVLDVLRGDEQLKTIPVIMISVTDQSHLVGQVDNVVNALTKPLNRNSLLQAIESALHTTRV